MILKEVANHWGCPNILRMMKHFENLYSQANKAHIVLVEKKSCEKKQQYSLKFHQVF